MRALAIATALVLMTAPAWAGQVTLKADTTDSDGAVTLSDLFDGAGSAGDVLVAARGGQTVVLDAGAVQTLARRSGLEWANAEGIRRIVVRGDVGGGGAPSARSNVEVLAYARSLAAGEILQPDDLVWAKVAVAPADAPSDADQVIGLAAKRPLRAGATVLARDVSAPQVIKPGDAVTVTYEAEGISLALQGKAMTPAAQGDTVMVQNTSSKKIIQATAIGPGQALIGPQAGRMRLNPRSQIALR